MDVKKEQLSKLQGTTPYFYSISTELHPKEICFPRLIMGENSPSEAFRNICFKVLTNIIKILYKGKFKSSGQDQ